MAVGDFGDLFEEYRAHVRRWDLDVDDLTYVMMRQALAGAALQLSFKKGPETVGWTLNIKKPALNLFIASNTDTCTVTGRAFTEGVKTVESSRLYVQSMRPLLGPSNSVIEVDGLDVLEIYEQYFDRSVQTATRFLELSDEEIVMIQGLPRVDPDWIRSLTREDAAALVAAEVEPVEERTFRFLCGCDGEKVARALTGIWGHDPDELFRGEEGVEVLCPRCGVRWWIDRDSFHEAGDEESLDS